MEIKHLTEVERWTAILAALSIAAATLFLSRQTAFAVSLGAGIMVLNTYALKKIGERVLKTFKRPGLAVLLFNVKMAVLIAIVFAVIRYARIDAIGFLLGISVFPVAIFVVAIRSAFTQPTTVEENQNG